MSLRPRRWNLMGCVYGVGTRWSGKLLREVSRLGEGEAEGADGGLPRWMTRLEAAFQLPSRHPPQTAKYCSHPCHKSSAWLAQAL